MSTAREDRIPRDTDVLGALDGADLLGLRLLDQLLLQHTDDHGVLVTVSANKVVVFLSGDAIAIVKHFSRLDSWRRPNANAHQHHAV